MRTSVLWKVPAMAAVLAAGTLVSAGGASASDVTFNLTNLGPYKMQGGSWWKYSDGGDAQYTTSKCVDSTLNGSDFGWDIEKDRHRWAVLNNNFFTCSGGRLVYHAWAGPVGPAHQAAMWDDFSFDAHDPSIGASWLACSLKGEYATLATARVSGLGCWIENPPKLRAKTAGNAESAHVRLSASKALVRNGKARVPVAVYGGESWVLEGVTLRSRNGSVVHGTAQAVARVGNPRYIKVPISDRLENAVKRNKEVKVRATVAHADNTPGTGQKETIVLAGEAKRM